MPKPNSANAGKRLNKRQQREAEELEQLNALHKQAEPELRPEDDNDGSNSEGDARKQGAVEDEETEEKAGAAPLNPFDALEGEEVEEEDEESAEEEVSAAPKKSKKKNKKKKKKPTAVDPSLDSPAPGTTGPSTPARTGKKGKKGGATPGPAADADDGMDEVDRALAELNVKYGEGSTARGTGGDGAADTAGKAGTGSSMLGLRALLSVDPKNLDADAELRRFFGSKVISTGASSSRSHRAAPSPKLRYTISKPKPNYPPATSLAGLAMRELADDEVDEVHAMRVAEWRDPGEKWFTFEHAGNWREITRQFLGAVQSHDPNTLMALLQVFPWHVDTLLQMSEVYRLQSDIGAASDYAERALYALDRCLIPAFNVSSGTCRLDFNRVENRPMFMALHRIISYLGRRGCWVTAFNFAKLLFSLDPMNDPHGAAFWLDFLAVKSGNHAWVLDVFEKQAEHFPTAVFQGYPGMAYAYALACRAREDAEKDKDRTRSDDALREAMLAFPQVILPLADKLGMSLPPAARSEPLLAVQAGYSDDPLTPLHLLSHIYVSRSEALWKEPALQKWFETAIPSNLADMHRPDAAISRADALRLIHTPRDPLDEQLGVPLFICRHVLCSESTSFVGFLPPAITRKSFQAFDPLPPATSVSAYDAEYFSGVRASRRGGAWGGAVGGAGVGGMMGDFVGRVFAAVDANPGTWRDVLRENWRGMLGQAGVQGGGPEGAGEAVDQLVEIAEQLVQEREAGVGLGAGGDGAEDAGGMPGAFPGADRA